MRKTIKIRLAGLATASAAGLMLVVPGAFGAATESYFDSTFAGVCQNATNITASGSSAQRSALNTWIANFGPDAGADYSNCQAFTPGTGTKTITYTATDSGHCLDAFGRSGPRDPDNTFCATELPPSSDETNTMEAAQGSLTNDDLETIPVAQLAITVIVRLPDNCEVYDASKRVISRSALEGAYEGNVTTWGAVFGSNIIGDGTISNTACRAKQFAVVVRHDESGSTYIFKKYLQQAALANGSSFDWREARDGGTLANDAWPSFPGLTPADANGGGSLVSKVSAQATNGAIGYVDLATARGASPSYGWAHSGTSYTATDTSLFLKVQRIADDTYVSPAVNNYDDVTASGKGANCVGVTYSNLPDAGFSWTGVSGTGTTADYPICGLTYQIAWRWGRNNVSPYRLAYTNAVEGNARTYRDFLRYELGVYRPNAGPASLPKSDYAQLPSAVLAKSKSLAGQIGWWLGSAEFDQGD